MQIKTHEPKQKYKNINCEVCGRYKKCTWHHIDLRRYSDRWIWACVFDGYLAGCHEKIHNPTGFGLPSDWAYKRGLLTRGHNSSNKTMKKKKKKPKCKHPVTLFSHEKGDFVCQFCGKVIGELRTGGSKKKKSSKK